jgi:serine/threonine protein kinase/formylglycine-generating enzyme required for sulfatase activity
MNGVENFGEYEVQKREDGSLFELGRGAMGVTYKAFDTHLHRFVALKTISPAAMARPDAEERFIREARSAAQLRHPNIAAVFGCDVTPDGTHYYAMEFCEGQTIEQLVRQEGPLEWRRALEIAAQAADALAAAARKNLIHRDIKPANLMLVREDESEALKVIDFGLAKITADDSAAWSSMGTEGFIGTAHFASPEQIQNGIVDTRSDIYSLGATLWFMLLGSPPFKGSIWEIVSRHLTAEPDFTLLNGLPETVVALIHRMLAKIPEDRPQTALELVNEIEGCLETEKEKKTGKIRSEPRFSGPSPFSDETPRNGTQPNERPEILRIWTLSLLDLLRARSALAPMEAWRLGEALAAILDAEDPADPAQGALLIHKVIVHFRDPMSESDAGAKLREPVTAWPPFDLSIDTSEAPEAVETAIPGAAETIFTAGDAAGDRVQQLARLLYELLGGVAGSRCAPLASLGERGNDLLRQGILTGLMVFSCAADLIQAFRAISAQVSPQSPPHPEAPAIPLEESSAIVPRTRRPIVAAGIIAGTVTFPIALAWIIISFQRMPPAPQRDYRTPTPSPAAASTPTATIGVLNSVKPTPPEVVRIPPPISPTTSSIQTVATKETTFVNSLGMRFVPVEITGGPTNGMRVLFSVWDTRVQDYGEYVREKGITPKKPPFELGPTHPVVEVSWEDAKSFCAWLTGKERASGRIGVGEEYRLPSDHEWSCAVGIGRREKAEASAASKDGKIAKVYPWGTQWPPPKGAGNYGSSIQVDEFEHTSPVGSFAANANGLYDMGGNVWQWCEDAFDAKHEFRVVRGASWGSADGILLRSSCRYGVPASLRHVYYGFRCVLAFSDEPRPVRPTMPEVPRTTPPIAPTASSTLTMATKGAPFVNSLGMKFVPVEITGGPTNGKRVLFSVWDTRVQDYGEYARETGITPKKAPFESGPTHPVVEVSWEDAKSFCAWLTRKERASGRIGVASEYRLPSDHEWSCAVGIGRRENAGASAASQDGKVAKVYPWGTQWPPPKGAGNYGSSIHVDEFEHTSPVGSFAANANGLYDMGGNAWQWCEDAFDAKHEFRVVRGGSWGSVGMIFLRSSCRYGVPTSLRHVYYGFRCVLVVSGG